MITSNGYKLQHKFWFDQVMQLYVCDCGVHFKDELAAQSHIAKLSVSPFMESVPQPNLMPDIIYLKNLVGSLQQKVTWLENQLAASQHLTNQVTSLWVRLDKAEKNIAEWLDKEELF